MSMVPFLASLVMAGAGCVAVAAIVITVRSQLPAVLRLLAEARTLAADREYLVQITATPATSEPRLAIRPRRGAVRVVKPVPAPVSAARPLRAAA